MSLFRNIARAASKVGRALRKAAPEIAIVTGTAGVVTAGVVACVKTPKAMKIVEEHKEKMETVNQCLEDGVTSSGEEYTEEDARKDRLLIFGQDAGLMVRNYAIPVAIAALSILAIFGGSKIFRKRLTAITGAYALLEQSFSEYRKNVVEKFGKDIDQELRLGLKKELVEKTTIDENGNEKKEMVEETTTTYDGYSQYARFFDENSTCWEKDGGHNLSFLINQQKYANDKLRSEGILFLNDVYASIGLPRTEMGQFAGWIYDPSNPDIDSYVDFGIEEVVTNRAKFKEFMKDHERSLLLDFNCDGTVTRYLEKLDIKHNEIYNNCKRRLK